MTVQETGVPAAIAGFATYDDEFGDVLGAEPRLVKVVDIDAHEGPVYVAEEDALYFTSLPRTRIEAGLEVPLVDIRRLALDGLRFPLEPDRVSVNRRLANSPNGMTLAPDGSLIISEQGSWSRPARLSRMDRRTGLATTLVDAGKGRG